MTEQRLKELELQEPDAKVVPELIAEVRSLGERLTKAMLAHEKTIQIFSMSRQMNMDLLKILKELITFYKITEGATNTLGNELKEYDVWKSAVAAVRKAEGK